MAPRQRRSRAHLLTTIVVALTACAPTAAIDIAPASTTTSSTLASTTTTAVPPTTTTSPAPSSTSTTLSVSVEFDGEVLIPDGEGPFPTVVLVHGGGWVGGSIASTRSLATYLTGEGFLTVNAPYRLSNESPGYPWAVEDIACAVRFAATHPQSDGTVALVGHSAGAHIGAVVALTGDDHPGECPYTGSGVPDRFVGLAGPYDVERLGILILPFFGEGPASNPEIWASGNPQNLTGQNTDLVSLIMLGELDGIVDDSFGFEFNRALTDSGSSSILEVVEGARHTDMVDPAFVGPLIATWLER